jgi:phosphatidylserine/phosphatidylglycerophosphate/cardiolipin synthase-like enzyme
VENGSPAQVWTGSTNITIRGIFGHSNTGHWIKNNDIAEKYFDYWQKLSCNPAKKDFVEVTEKIQKDIDGSTLRSGTKVIFSPRKSDAMLKEYIDLMDCADKAVCIIFPFNIEDIFKDFYAKDKKYLRFIITDKPGKKTDFYTNDRDVIRTQGAILDSPVENWVKEITSKATTGASTLYVHNKFFIVDPLGKYPVIVSGSANFSDESLKDNDENMLIIKGNKRAADIYFSEFVRMFDHFLPRFLQKTKKTKKGFSKPLDDTGKWCEEYYDKDKLVEKRKQMFVTMVK